MKSLWGKFDDSIEENRNPKEILEVQAEYFNTMEDNYSKVVLKKRRLTSKGKEKFTKYDINTGIDFVYRFDLESEYIPDYSYTLFTIYYGIRFYPLCIKIDESVEKEVLNEQEFVFECIDPDMSRYIIKSEEQFVTVLNLILKTKEVMTIVNNMNKIARERSEQSMDTISDEDDF